MHGKPRYFTPVNPSFLQTSTSNLPSGIVISGCVFGYKMAITNRSSRAFSPQGILRALVFLIPWSLHLLLANLLLTFTLIPSVFIPSQIYALNSQIVYTVWKAIQNFFERKRGARISFSGDPLPLYENALVVSNHVSWSDLYLVQAVAARAGMLGSCRYFAKAQLKWVPLLGWGLVAVGMPMVTRNWASDRREFEALFQGIKNGGWPICKLFIPSFKPELGY